ncbi:50S ribosomal protein L4 [Nanoarchaeota archaeon]
MKLKILSAGKIESGTKELPKQFNEDIRPDLIKKAVLVIQSNNRQPYGSDPEAGKRASVRLSKKRNDYRGMYGHGISRIPRKIMSRRGTRLNWTGAFAPGTVGGRRAHPPKAIKIWDQKINKKERRKAIRSAISATIAKPVVEGRGHKAPEAYPFIVETKIQDLKSTKDVKKALTMLGFKEELARTSERSIRAGKGKSRGRKYKTKVGPLIVVSNECILQKTAANIPGVDIIEVQNLNAELLAPGTIPGRLTLWTAEAIERLEKERLFMNDYKAPKEEVKEEKPIEKPKKEKKPKKKVVKK